MQQRTKEKKKGKYDKRVQGIRFVIFSMGNRVRKGRAVLTVLQLAVAMQG
jgi:hypothetical protein